MKRVNNYLAVLMLLLFFNSLSAQVVINEYSASNLHSFLDSYQRTEDWIELYNTTDVAVDIGGWHLSDKETKPEKWEIPQGTMIPANGHLVFLCSGRDTFISAAQEYHTNFKLAQTKANEVVLLSNAAGDVQEMHPLAITLVEHSWCRSIDGNSDWKVCTVPSFGTTNVGTPQYKRYTVEPTINLDAGFYQGTQTVSITNNEPNSVMRYTLDGTNPTPSSPEYTEPLTIDETQVVKAQSFSNDELVLTGKMDFHTFLIDEEFTLAVFSVAANDVIELANGQGSLIPIGSIEYFDTNQELQATSFGSLNRHGQDSWVLPHRSLDWVSRDEMGYSKAVQAPLFHYSERDEYQKFMFRNSGDDNYPAINDANHEGSTHIRDEYVQTLAMEGGLKLDERAVERVILFLNGQYWGVYGMRERPVDHDYTKEYYDQGKYDIQYLSTWGNTDIEYGGLQARTDWETLRNFILSNDMGNEDNYELVKDQLNLISLMDYMIVNLNCVASDWLNYNTGWWRGLDPEGDHKKWGYILWDLDATFDYYINYSGVPNTTPTAQPCDIEEIADFMDDFFGGEDFNPVDNPEECFTITSGSSPYPATDTVFQMVIGYDAFCCENEWDDLCQDRYDEILAGVDFSSNDVGRHEKIFLKLQEESETFRQLYYSRQADLQNTVYTCENMLTTLDSMLAVIEPEMPRQIQRWGGTMDEWQQNVQDLKDFISQRCANFSQGMTDCFDLTGPFDLTLQVEPAGAGTIKMNTIDIESFPWTGAYYGVMDNIIKAKPADEYVFSHWESNAGHPISPNINERTASIQLEGQDTLIAVFNLITDTKEVLPQVDVNVYPNPTTGTFSINYDLEKKTDVEMSLWSVRGQLLHTLLNAQEHTAGEYLKTFNLDQLNMPAGIYIVKMRVGQQELIHKLTVL